MLEGRWFTYWWETQLFAAASRIDMPGHGRNATMAFFQIAEDGLTGNSGEV
jgi:hypothetical protein